MKLRFKNLFILTILLLMIISPVFSNESPYYFKIIKWGAKQGGFSDTQKWVSGDFNGDGINCDLANIFNDNGQASIDVHWSSGSGFNWGRWGTQQGGFSDTQKWVSGDFNNDGKCDLANIFNDNGQASIDVHWSSGSGFNWGRWGTQQGGFSDTQKWVSGDFNNDGKCDLANIFNDNGQASIDVHWSSGSGFNWGRWGTQQGGFSDTQKWVSGDFNGDGKWDLANIFNDNGQASIDVHWSSGSGFNWGRWGTQQGGFSDTQKWVSGDFNGDGKWDLANIFNDNGKVSIDIHWSTGSGFNWGRCATQKGNFNDNQKWISGDFNHDGKAELCNVFNEDGQASMYVYIYGLNYPCLRIVSSTIYPDSALTLCNGTLPSTCYFFDPFYIFARPYTDSEPYYLNVICTPLVTGCVDIYSPAITDLRNFAYIKFNIGMRGFNRPQTIKLTMKGLFDGTYIQLNGSAYMTFIDYVVAEEIYSVSVPLNVFKNANLDLGDIRYPFAMMLYFKTGEPHPLNDYTVRIYDIRLEEDY